MAKVILPRAWTPRKVLGWWFRSTVFPLPSAWHGEGQFYFVAKCEAPSERCRVRWQGETFALDMQVVVRATMSVIIWHLSLKLFLVFSPGVASCRCFGVGRG